MTQLRRMMLEELQRRDFSQATVRAYLLAVRQFAEYFHRPPDQLGPDHIRRFQCYLLQERKLSPRTVVQRVAALRFLFVKTLKRHYMLEHIPFPKAVRRLPIVLSQEEVGRLIDSASNLMHRTMLMTLYSTGIRRAELCRLQVCDIDSQRKLMHIRAGKGGATAPCRDARQCTLYPHRPQTARSRSLNLDSIPKGAASAANASGLVQTPQSKVPRREPIRHARAPTPGHFRLSHSVCQDDPLLRNQLGLADVGSVSDRAFFSPLAQFRSAPLIVPRPATS